MKYLLAVMLLLSVGCAHKKVVMNEKPFYNESGGASGTLLWAKDKTKRNKFDASITFENKYKYPVLIESNAMSMVYNGVKSSNMLKSNRRMVLEPGAAMSEIVVFRFDEKLESDGDKTGKFKVSRIYSYKNDEKGKKLKPIIIPFTLNKAAK